MRLLSSSNEFVPSSGETSILFSVAKWEFLHEPIANPNVYINININIPYDKKRKLLNSTEMPVLWSLNIAMAAAPSQFTFSLQHWVHKLEKFSFHHPIDGTKLLRETWILNKRMHEMRIAKCKDISDNAKSQLDGSWIRNMCHRCVFSQFAFNSLKHKMFF